MSQADTRHMDRRPPSECVLYANFSQKTIKDLSNFAQAPSAIGTLITFGIDGSGVSYGEATGANSAQNSIQFADNDRYSLTDGAGQDLSCSVIAWFYVDSYATGETIATIISKAVSYASTFEYQFMAGCNSGNPYGHSTGLQQRYGSPNGALILDARFTQPSTGAWHHYVATYSGNEATTGLNLYIDGALVASTKSKSGSYVGMSNGSAVLRLFALGSGQVLDGKLSKVLLFKNRVLTAQEISESFSNGPTN